MLLSSSISRHSIVTKLIVSLLAVSSVVTLVLTTWQLVDDYRYEIGRVDTNIELLAKSSFDSLTKALWNFDNPQVATILSGFTVIPHISYVELEVLNGEHYKAGVLPLVSFQRKDINLYHERTRPEVFATLHFYVSIESIYRRLLSKVLMLFCANAIKTLIVCSFMAVVIHRIIIKHLVVLAAEVKDMAGGGWRNLADFVPVKPASNDDEIGMLRCYFNDMRNNLISAFTQREEYLKKLEDSKRDVEAASRAKSVFLANMSHELRTPLNAIIGFSALLTENRMSYALNDDVAAMIARINMAGSHLLRLISDLLDIAMIEDGRMTIQKSNILVRDIIVEALTMKDAEIVEKKITVDLIVAADLTVVTDAVRLRQIISNLITNAIKFTNEGGHIKLTAETREQNLAILVSDSGIGIAPEHQELIFHEFLQLNAGITRKYGGVGLGLAICRKLVEMLGGRIWVESYPGQGSTFGILLPL